MNEETIRMMYKLSLRKHLDIDEDPWYSCPKSSGGSSNDSYGDECTCGADAHNKKVRDLYINELGFKFLEESYKGD